MNCWQYRTLVPGFIFAAALVARGDQIVMRIRMGNPQSEPQTVEIREPLPAGLCRQDIFDLDGLTVEFSDKDQCFRVIGQCQIGPKEIATKKNVVFRDVWRIEESKIESLSTQADDVVKRLQHVVDDARRMGITNFMTTIVIPGWIQSLTNDPKKLCERQLKYTFGPNVSLNDHIAAHKKNLLQMDFIVSRLRETDEFLRGYKTDPEEFLKRRNAEMEKACHEPVVEVTFILKNDPGETKSAPTKTPENMGSK